eukprot:4298011-Prymnesium_polylepis.1
MEAVVQAADKVEAAESRAGEVRAEGSQRNTSRRLRLPTNRILPGSTGVPRRHRVGRGVGVGSEVLCIGIHAAGHHRHAAH